jgi:hypothetical protein
LSANEAVATGSARVMDDVFCRISGSSVRAPFSQVSLRPGQKVDLGINDAGA